MYYCRKSFVLNYNPFGLVQTGQLYRPRFHLVVAKKGLRNRGGIVTRCARVQYDRKRKLETYSTRKCREDDVSCESDEDRAPSKESEDAAIVARILADICNNNHNCANAERCGEVI